MSLLNLVKAFLPGANPLGFAPAGGGATNPPSTEATGSGTAAAKTPEASRAEAQALAQPEATSQAPHAAIPAGHATETATATPAVMTAPATTTTHTQEKVVFDTSVLARVAQSMIQDLSLSNSGTGNTHQPLDTSTLAPRLEKVLTNGSDHGLILKHRSDAAFQANPDMELRREVLREYVTRALDPEAHLHQQDPSASMSSSIAPILSLATKGDAPALRGLLSQVTGFTNISNDPKKSELQTQGHDAITGFIVNLAKEKPDLILKATDDSHFHMDGLLETLARLPHGALESVTHSLGAAGEKLLLNLQPLSREGGVKHLLRWDSNASHGLKVVAAQLLAVVKGIETQNLGDVKAGIIATLEKVSGNAGTITQGNALPKTSANNETYAQAA